MEQKKIFPFGEDKLNSMRKLNNSCCWINTALWVATAITLGITNNDKYALIITTLNWWVLKIVKDYIYENTRD